VTSCIEPGAPSVEGPDRRVISPLLPPTEEPVWMDTLPLSENLEEEVLMNTELLSPLSESFAKHHVTIESCLA
jgi:hypothetical protein